MSGIKMNKYKEEDYCPRDGTKLSGNWGGFINGYKKKIRVWVCKKCGYRATKERDDGMSDEIEYLIIQTINGTWKVVKKETFGKNYYTWCNLRYFDTKEKAEKYKNKKEGI